MKNFDYLYNTNRSALVDLLQCHLPGHKCQYCSFRVIGYSKGFCGRSDEFGEEETVDWLSQESSGEPIWK